MPARTRVSHVSPASACAGGSARLVASVTRHRGEKPGADPQRRAHAPGRDDQAADGGADGEAERERDVQQRVAGVELAVGLERGGHRRARQRAADEREDPVRRGQNEHEDQPRRRGQQRQRREDRGLGEVERRQYATDAEAVELRGGGRSDERGDQQRAQPQAGRGQRAVRVIEDHQAERDRAKAPAELVERVGGRQPPEGGVAKRAERDHSGGLSDQVTDALTLRRRSDTPLKRAHPSLRPGWRTLLGAWCAPKSDYDLMFIPAPSLEVPCLGAPLERSPSAAHRNRRRDRGNHTYVRKGVFRFSKGNCMPTSARFV